MPKKHLKTTKHGRFNVLLQDQLTYVLSDFMTYALY